MADYGNNRGSFDVDKELEELMKNLHMPQQAPRQQTPQQPPRAQAPQQRPVQQPMRQQMPQQAQPQRPAQQPMRQQVPQQAQPQRPAQQQPMRQQMPQQAQPQRSVQPAQPPHPEQQRQTQQRQSRTSRLPFLNNAQPKTKITTTTKNGMKIYEDKTDYSRMDDSNASYYSGEVYFAAKKPIHPQQVAAKPKQFVPQNKFEEIVYNLSKAIREGGNRGIAIYVGILFVIAICLSAFTMSLIGDILAFNRSDEVITITVGEDATTNKIITQLDKEGLIKHGWFCKLFMGLTKSLHEISGPPVYLSGVYYLTPDMGVEKMLLSCQETKTADTVTVTIPEGFTIAQIASKLEKSGVCMSDEFYKNLDSATFKYGFLKTIDNKDARYNYLEGYLYPDTYEFFVGQNASSVINKLFENFDERWTDEYQKRADAIGMTVDDVVTLASIIQKEAANGEQMPVISGVFFNRLNSTGFPSLQSDATNVYVNKYIKPNVTTGEYDTYWAGYSTYACRGLPVGPICNPGDDAIRAVLWPESTDAYYFCHDKAGNIYTAKTEQEHNANYYSTLS